jgi:hypothetical protein
LAEAHLALAQAEVILDDRPHAVAEAESAARIAGHGPIADKARAISGGAASAPVPRARPGHGSKGKHRKGK